MTESIEGRFASIYDGLFGIVLAPIRRYTATVIGRLACRQVVDLGCGTGDQCIHVWRCNPGVVVHGIDVSPQMISVARKKSPPEIMYHVADSRATCFDDNQFDCGIVSLVLHAQTSEDRYRILGEIHRIVKAHGTIIITDFGCLQSWRGVVPHAVVYAVESFTLDDHRKNFQQFRKNGAIRALIESNAFAVIASKSFYANAIDTIVVRNR